MTQRSRITVQAIVYAPLHTAWSCWTDPQHIVQWAFASDTWEALHAENDVRVGGSFKTTMAAKDKSAQFDFTGTYTEVTVHSKLACTLDDDRYMLVQFEQLPDGVRITEIFETESENSEDLQRSGWQAILDNFKKHTESQSVVKS